MSSKIKVLGSHLAACSLLGLVTISFFPADAAAKSHDSQAQAKVSTERRINAGSAENIVTDPNERGSIVDRINAILHPEPEEMAAEQPNYYILPGVPTTTSPYDTSIIGTAMASEAQCVKYLLSVNPYPKISVSPEELVSYYYQEGGREGIRPDVAFAQALKETGFFRYGGDVVPEQNNYCGLGTTGGGVKGAYFSTSKLGVRAHIQHLLAYASTRKPSEPVVDPRYELVRSTYGSTTLGQWQDLNGRWAVPGTTYGQSIMTMYRDILKE